MNEINKNVQISIFGQEYSVKAPADASYIKKIAEYLDSKMREVQEGFSNTQSSTRIAILAAMNIPSLVDRGIYFKPAKPFS